MDEPLTPYLRLAARLSYYGLPFVSSMRRLFLIETAEGRDCAKY